MLKSNYALANKLKAKLSLIARKAFDSLGKSDEKITVHVNLLSDAISEAELVLAKTEQNLSEDLERAIMNSNSIKKRLIQELELRSKSK